MAYSKFHEQWRDRPSLLTPIKADALNHIEEGIAEAHRLAEAGGGSGGALVEDPPGSGLYSPSSAGLTEDPSNPGLYLI
ncbi:hypothetical protein K3M35_05005 [Rhodococcus sp. DMU2021]|uniref:hypothetical protein n=1 Tax=Rhodococcus sp. DMU2021 TaxID=2866997 RepID=UPI001C7D77F9|nr:hypothetical protein [Rhodococcus sp. DMU2021]MBX4168025.1 hypothetical protein [Rhodococcus sp. DMU2021]